MNLADVPFHDQIDDAIQKVEARSSAELVVVLSPRSGTYRDRAHLVAAVVTFLALVAAMYSPFLLAEHWVLVELVIVYAFTAWLIGRNAWVLRTLTPASRRERAVQKAARAAFVEEAMTGTRDRTGILYYYSRLEDRLEILPDAGVLARVGEGPFLEIQRDFHDGEELASERLLRALTAAGPVLEGPLPRAEDDEDELSNRPRVRGEDE